MAGSGRISVLVSRDLGVLLSAALGMEAELRAQFRKRTKAMAEPAWKESVRGHVTTRLQTRVLADTARVAVADLNVTLKSATVGKVGGVKASVLAGGAEFGGNSNVHIRQRSRSGRTYTRRRGNAFGPPRKDGNAVFPAARLVIPRIVSLWMQTAYRTVAEEFEKGAR